MARAPRAALTDATPSAFARIRDGFVNLVNNLGTPKDPRMATTYAMTPLTSAQLLTAYRSNWLARRIVDSIAEDATREWRDWQASDEQIQVLEDEEKKHGIQGKVKNALIRARLFGGGGLVMGIDGTGDVNEPLDLERVGQGSLKFVVVLSSNEMSRGQMISDVTNEWFGRPEYYTINSARATIPSADIPLQARIHPSRVVEFVGAEIPDWNATNGTMTWGDSALQVVDEVLKDYGLTVASVAAIVNDSKVDVFTIPGLTKMISDKAYEQRLTTRLTVSNQMKSSINAMLMDKDEAWERVQSNFSGLPDIMAEYIKIVAGAAGIPMTRLVGHGTGSGKSSLGSGKSGGESDLRNYYDSVESRQKNEFGPAMASLDQVIQRSATGTIDDKIYYEWAPLYIQDPSEKADEAVKKSQVYTADVNAGLINPDVLREVRLNQLVEDGFYPGLEAAVDEFGSEPDEPQVGPEDVQAHIAMLQSSSSQLQKIGKQAALPAPGGDNVGDASPTGMEMLRSLLSQ